MLMQLRDNGAINLDDPVDKYMVGFSVKSPYKTKRKITLRELASHTSGLQRGMEKFLDDAHFVRGPLWLEFHGQMQRERYLE
jgi:CubicO group peptidase (beta-lactamase class C family)